MNTKRWPTDFSNQFRDWLPFAHASSHIQWRFAAANVLGHGTSPFEPKIGTLTRYQIDTILEIWKPRKENEDAEAAMGRDVAKLESLSDEDYLKAITVDIPEPESNSGMSAEEWDAF